MDTICTIACHIINTIQVSFQNNQGEVDTSLDCCDVAGAKDKDNAKNSKGKGKGGGGGGSSQLKRANDLFDFL